MANWWVGGNMMLSTEWCPFVHIHSAKNSSDYGKDGGSDDGNDDGDRVNGCGVSACGCSGRGDTSGGGVGVSGYCVCVC